MRLSLLGHPPCQLFVRIPALGESGSSIKESARREEERAGQRAREGACEQERESERASDSAREYLHT